MLNRQVAYKIRRFPHIIVITETTFGASVLTPRTRAQSRPSSSAEQLRWRQHASRHRASSASGTNPLPIAWPPAPAPCRPRTASLTRSARLLRENVDHAAKRIRPQCPRAPAPPKPSMPFLKSTGRSAISTFRADAGDNHDAAFQRLRHPGQRRPRPPPGEPERPATEPTIISITVHCRRAAPDVAGVSQHHWRKAGRA